MRGRMIALTSAAVVFGACSSPADVVEGNALYANIEGQVAAGTSEDLSTLLVVMRVEFAGMCEERQTGIALELPVDAGGAFSRTPLVVDPGLAAMGICLIFELRGEEAVLASLSVDSVEVHVTPVTSDTILVQLP
jgi:hypothetical protein